MKHEEGQKRADKILRSEPIHRFNDFAQGQIVKFDPGYHTTKPYYAQVIYYDPLQFLIIMSIPGYGQQKIWARNNWDYHSRRMHIVGPPNEENLKLLNNQIIE